MYNTRLAQIISKRLPLYSVAWAFHFHLIDMSFFHIKSVARASYLVIVHTYDKAGPSLVPCATPYFKDPKKLI